MNRHGVDTSKIKAGDWVRIEGGGGRPLQYMSLVLAADWSDKYPIQTQGCHVGRELICEHREGPLQASDLHIGDRVMVRGDEIHEHAVHCVIPTTHNVRVLLEKHPEVGLGAIWQHRICHLDRLANDRHALLTLCELANAYREDCRLRDVDVWNETEQRALDLAANVVKEQKL